MKYNIGDTFNTDRYGVYQILNVYEQPLSNGNMRYSYDVVFVNTGTIINVSEKLIGTEYVSDSNYANTTQTVSNVGIVGNPVQYGYDSNNKTHIRIFKLWKNTVQSCYDINNQKYYLNGGRGITVCDRWLRFDNFFYDFTHMENYHIWENPKSKYTLIINRLNTSIYSPETAVIGHVHNNIVNSVTNNSGIEGKYSGVFKRKDRNIYTASLNYNGENVMRASFPDGLSAAIYRDWYARYYFGPNCGLNNVDMSYEAFHDAQLKRIFPKHGKHASEGYKQLYRLSKKDSDKK